jgi:hypothetical protein
MKDRTLEEGVNSCWMKIRKKTSYWNLKEEEL